MSRSARRPDGRCLPGSPGDQRKVRAPREYGAGQPPAGVTPGKVPQKTNRPRIRIRPQGLIRRSAGKGEMARQERTAPLATGAAGQTPPGARPNRGGRQHGREVPLRPVAAEAFPPRRPGWSREARREARPRGMVVPPRPGNLSRGNLDGADRTRLTGRLALHSPQGVASSSAAAHKFAHRNKTKTPILTRKDRGKRNHPGPPPSR